ncbi:hypothetical protein OHC51_10330 [Stenotrophomonas indicatrix]|uniref:hypothetical protein n=1 Tax=Stenotrophomonas indicatrix TaxID=2045451 RepID=UPI00300BF07E
MAPTVLHTHSTPSLTGSGCCWRGRPSAVGGVDFLLLVGVDFLPLLVGVDFLPLLVGVDFLPLLVGVDLGRHAGYGKMICP